MIKLLPLMTEDGQLNFFNDDTITITGGNTKTSGECVNIVGKNGGVTITAMKNGTVKIKGTNINIDADENINIESKKNVTIHGKSSIYFDTPNLATNALTGNLAPRMLLLVASHFVEQKLDKVKSNAFTGGQLESLESSLYHQGTLQNELKDINQYWKLNLQKNMKVSNQLSSIDTSGF